MNKIQLTFTPEETSILDIRAKRLGYSIPKYLKLLIGREVLSDVEEMSPKFLKMVEEAKAEYKAGKGKKFKNVEDAIKYLHSIDVLE